MQCSEKDPRLEQFNFRRSELAMTAVAVSTVRIRCRDPNMRRMDLQKADRGVRQDTREQNMNLYRTPRSRCKWHGQAAQIRGAPVLLWADEGGGAPLPPPPP